ncbi:MAG TPA: phosphoribosylformylglycinamidine synthase subunit PurQ [Planctomycetaceae bacterium]|nr:phosphoribosylformylglycinamidine synthase subunit PurQ [Planctomycetaceae bacterium]
MPAPRVCVLRAPGTNCDEETAFAFASCGAAAERVHLFQLLEHPQQLAEYQVLCVPGGFSYGDDIGAGVIFASQLRGHLGEALGEFLKADKLALGICNGFQVLLKAGILPGGATEWPPRPDIAADATLTWNDNGKYTALWVRLKCRSSNNVFLRGIEEIDIPIAHGEGKLIARDPSIINRWHANGQIALTYSVMQASSLPATQPQAGCRPDDVLPFPTNPNGSMANIAGLGDPTGRVLGLMPHPERFLFATQHPQWTRLGLRGEGAGMQIFRNAVEYFRA